MHEIPTYDVFISYRWVEPEMSWVRDHLAPKLQAAGVRTLLDVEDFVPGRDLILEMDRAGRESRHVLCILSPAYFDGDRMVAFESLAARRGNPAGSESRLIPLLLCPAEMPEWIRGLVPIDWTSERGQVREWNKLLRLLGAPRKAEPPPILGELNPSQSAFEKTLVTIDDDIPPLLAEQVSTEGLVAKASGTTLSTSSRASGASLAPEVRTNQGKATSNLAQRIHFAFKDVGHGLADIVVQRTYETALLDNRAFSFTVLSDSGIPHDPKVWIQEGQRRIFAEITERFVPDAKVADKFRCTAVFPAGVDGSRRTVLTTYRWRKAGLLSRAAVEKLTREWIGHVYSRFLYERFMEHVFVRCAQSRIPRTIDISVQLPEKWAPDAYEENVRVYVQSAAEERPQESTELCASIFEDTEGHYRVSIDRPVGGTRYFLAWRVRDFERR